MTILRHRYIQARCNLKKFDAWLCSFRTCGNAPQINAIQFEQVIAEMGI